MAPVLLAAVEWGGLCGAHCCLGLLEQSRPQPCLSRGPEPSCPLVLTVQRPLWASGKQGSGRSGSGVRTGLSQGQRLRWPVSGSMIRVRPVLRSLVRPGLGQGRGQARPGGVRVRVCQAGPTWGALGPLGGSGACSWDARPDSAGLLQLARGEGTCPGGSFPPHGHPCLLAFSLHCLALPRPEAAGQARVPRSERPLIWPQSLVLSLQLGAGGLQPFHR